MIVNDNTFFDCFRPDFIPDRPPLQHRHRERPTHPGAPDDAATCTIKSSGPTTVAPLEWQPWWMVGRELPASHCPPWAAGGQADGQAMRRQPHAAAAITCAMWGQATYWLSEGRWGPASSDPHRTGLRRRHSAGHRPCRPAPAAPPPIRTNWSRYRHRPTSAPPQQNRAPPPCRPQIRPWRHWIWRLHHPPLWWTARTGEPLPTGEERR
jgi:hypothetical protein